MASSAPAQQQQHQQPGETNAPVGITGWRVDCGNTGQALDCRTTIEAIDANRRQMVASITVRYAADTKKPVIGVQLPLGILVTQPVVVSVDNGPAENITIEMRTPAGCFASKPVSDALIAKMRTGRDIKLDFGNVNKQPITVSMPLAGFAIAYDKIKS